MCAGAVSIEDTRAGASCAVIVSETIQKKKKKRRGKKAAAESAVIIEPEGKVKFVAKAHAPKVRRPSVSSVGSKKSVASSRTSKSGGSRRSSLKAESKRKPSKGGRKVKAEGSIVGMSPAGSDYLGSSTAYASNAGSVVSDYLDMMINPWCGKLQRVPDVCITPTSLYKMFANRTYTVKNSGTKGHQLVFGCHSRLSNYSTGAVPTDTAVVWSTGTPSTGVPTNTTNVYQCSPGNILTPLQINDSGVYTTLDGSTPTTYWTDDYGGQQAELVSWTSAARCLSLAIRVRVVGLPSAQFMAPGKIYFTQVRWDADDVPLTEQDYVVLEQKGRASHVSLDAVRASGSKTFFATPDGAQKFELSSSFVPAPGMYAKIGTDATEALWQGGRRFVGPGDVGQWALNVAGSASPLTLSHIIAPYNSSQSSVNDTDQANADQTYLLLCSCFGISDDTVLEVDYATCGEFLPDKYAPPGVETAVQVPNTRAMDEIFAAAAVVADLKPAMLQAAGDKTQIGLTVPHAFAPASAGNVVQEGRVVKSGLMRAVGRVSGGSYARVRNEGFLDSLGGALKGAASSALGSFAGHLADSIPRPPRRGRRSRYDDDDDY